MMSGYYATGTGLTVAGRMPGQAGDLVPRPAELTHCTLQFRDRL